MLLAAATKSLQVRLLVSSLECPSDGEFEIPAFFKDMERQAGSRSQVRPIDSIRVKSKYQAERCINNRHHNLKFHSSARSETRVRSGQEFHTLGLDCAFTVDELATQLILLQHPGVSDIEERRHDDDISHERYSIFKIRHTLAVAANVHNV